MLIRGHGSVADRLCIAVQKTDAEDSGVGLVKTDHSAKGRNVTAAPRELIITIDKSYRYHQPVQIMLSLLI